jgi:hypothetical protein
VNGLLRGAAWAAALAFCALAAQAEVESVDVYQRTDVLGGRPFGPSGAYERLAGVIHFTFDPDNEANAPIVDLDKAPLRADGRVGATADFMVLRPKDALEGRGIALLEVSNRGRKASLAYFNRAAPGSAPTSAEEYGDGFLMREGLTVIWVGWQADVPFDPGLLRLQTPIASENGESIKGLVRADWVVDEPVRTLPLGDRDHRAYPPADVEDPRNVLTRRAGREDKRELVPRSSWQFARELPNGEVVPDVEHIYSRRGFERGYVYELVYAARDPRVVGLGLAVVRDTLSYAKHDEKSLFPVEQGIAFGASQSGRFLRHFLYQGFNVDERGRKVFDGMLIHSAGAGRGSFNHRFAQPSRDAHRYSSFFYPTDIFPFSGRTQKDPLTGLEDGLFAAYSDADDLPRIMYTNSGYDYWGRAASLLHTTPDGTQDVPLMPNERVYALSSGQHYVDPWPPAGERLPGSPAWRGNPLEFRVVLKSLLAHLVEWIAEDREPPASAYPTLREGTLVPPERVAFPEIAGVTAPRVVHAPNRIDYGPRWPSGIIDREPPEIGPAYAALVPQVDALGNELGGVRAVEIAAPLATYTGWSLRIGLPNPSELVTDRGLFIPFKRPAGIDHGDTRPAVMSLYASRDAYLERARAAAQALHDGGYLLEEDVPAVIGRAEETWSWVIESAAAR